MGREIPIHLDNLPLVSNEKFYPLFEDQHRFLVLKGGAGSGKSVFAAMKFVLRAVCERDHHFVCFRKVARTARVSIWRELQKAIVRLNFESMFELNKTEMTMTCPYTNSVIRCVGMDDPEKLKSIEGMTSAWMEEATEFTQTDIEQVNLRLRGRTQFYKQIVLSFNPISIYHWLKARFYDLEDSAVERVNSTFEDNQFLDEEYRAELYKLKDRDPYLWKVYGEGEWGVVGNLVYGTFALEPWPQPFWPQERFYGLDFGYVHPTALIEVNLLEDRPYVRERLYETHMTTQDLIHWLQLEEISRQAPIYADSAEPDRIEEIAAAGFNIFPADKGPGSINAGIALVKAYRPVTLPENSNLNAEAATYKWAENKDGEVLDKPVDWANHALDALRYALFTHLRGRIEDEGETLTDLTKRLQIETLLPDFDDFERSWQW